MEYAGRELPEDTANLLNDCRNDIINEYRCVYCNSDAVKLEAYFEAPVRSTYEEKREILKNLVLAHYSPQKKKFMPSEDLAPLCLIHSIQRSNEIKNRMAEYYVFLGDMDLE